MAGEEGIVINDTTAGFRALWSRSLPWASFPIISMEGSWIQVSEVVFISSVPHISLVLCGGCMCAVTPGSHRCKTSLAKQKQKQTKQNSKEQRTLQKVKNGQIMLKKWRGLNRGRTQSNVHAKNI